MAELLGQKLLKAQAITEEQLNKAIARQQYHGGRLGHNLVALDFIKADELNTFLEAYPHAPKSIEQTGLDLSFIADLMLKHILFMGDFRLSDLAEAIKLPVSIVDAAIETLRRDKFVEIKGASEYARTTYNFTMTGQGKNRAGELLEICRYAGPAPVPLDDYRRMVEFQTIRNIVVDEGVVNKAFSHLILSERLLRRLGPAVSCGRAIFIYGPAGNGKTTIAETIGKILPGTVYIPHSLIVGGQIITIYDPVSHLPCTTDEDKSRNGDNRWICIKRPVIMTGGELTLETLDLDFNTISKFYEASLQLKANNGLFIVDDFGRQRMEPQHLLNRWIVPLERCTDFMTLHTGMKFDVPFDQLVIFATNLEPRNLVDEAFLRRIRYKIKIDHPTEDEYEAIFKKICTSNNIEFKEKVFDLLLKNYKKLGVKLNACHPRDLIEHIIDDAHYYNHTPELTPEAVVRAWENYFVEM